MSKISSLFRQFSNKSEEKTQFAVFAVYATVFMTGGCVLALELAALRILSPYFGNTLFATSSIITVVLGALSVGYAAGARLASCSVSRQYFYRIVTICGIATTASASLAQVFLPVFGYHLSLVTGPLISSAFLFFVPCFFFGLLSPLAVAVVHGLDEKRSAGAVSGSVFFWSTVGSIAGSLLTGFVFIPRIGVDALIVGAGVCIALIGCAGLIGAGARKQTIRKLATIMLFVSIFASSAVYLQGSSTGLLYHKHGIYELLAVSDGEYEGRPARFFTQDRSASGAAFLDGDDLPYPYTRFYELYRVFVPKASHMLVIGGGAYSIPKALLAELPADARIDVAEIEPSLPEIAQRFFGLPDDKRLYHIQEDGRRFLSLTAETYDVIISDVYYSLFSIPTHFTTKEFFQTTRSRLAPGGMIMLNLIGSLSRANPSLFRSELATFKTVFPHYYVFTVESRSSNTPQNIIVVGINDNDSPSADRFLGAPDAADVVQQLMLTERLVNPDRFNLEEATLLTDDYAPVEYLTAKELRRLQNGSESALDGDEMLGLVRQQLGYGPRSLYAPGHSLTQRFLTAELGDITDAVYVQQWEHHSEVAQPAHLKNIIGRIKPQRSRRIILATHYDTRRFADRDSRHPDLPVPGANDGASGTAVLLHMAHRLNNILATSSLGVDLVFFDGEEGEEGVTDEAWKPLGSPYFVQRLRDLYPTSTPVAAIVMDLVCDRNLLLPQELTSLDDAPDLVKALWAAANAAGATAFTSETGIAIADDHTVLNAAGIPSALVIDFDYPPFHTTRDTLEQCSGNSMQQVSGALSAYLTTLR